MKKIALVLTVILVLTGGADLWTTAQGNPSMESNRIARWLWEKYGFWSLIVFKGLAIICNVVPLFFLPKRIAHYWAAGALLGSVLWGYAAIHNWRVL